MKKKNRAIYLFFFVACYFVNVLSTNQSITWNDFYYQLFAKTRIWTPITYILLTFKVFVQ